MRIKLRLPVLIVLWGISQFATAQTFLLPPNSMPELRKELELLNDSGRNHLAVRPLALATSDSLQLPLHLKTSFNTRIFTILHASAGYESTSGESLALAGAGLAINQPLGPKWSIYADIFGGVARFPEFARDITNNTSVIPGWGYNYDKGAISRGFTGSGYINFQPSPVFDFEIGYGENFIGNGYHSLFLSDVASNYPYGKITTSIWNIKYINLYSAYKGLEVYPSGTDYKTKFSASHYLDWAVSKRVNIGFFETIIWQARDTMSNRGFDVHYLNPVIFYRPVEYSVGSPDNALMGLNLSVKIGAHSLLYGQVLIDEFLLDELLSKSGWWANKWGVQAGAKFPDAFNIPGLFVQLEANVVRPFTYTHGSVLQNYTHLNQSLAHPLGTNFYQSLLRLHYSRGPWSIDQKIIYAIFGRDPEGEKLGGDLYNSYIAPSKIYGNTIAQGNRHTLFQTNTVISYHFKSLPGMSAFLQAINRSYTADPNESETFLLNIGFRSLLYRSSMDYLYGLE